MNNKKIRFKRKFDFTLDDLVNSGMPQSKKLNYEIFNRAKVIADDDTLGKTEHFGDWLHDLPSDIRSYATYDDFDIESITYRKGQLSKDSRIKYPSEGVDIFNDKNIVSLSKINVYYGEKPVFIAEKCRVFKGPGLEKKEVYFKVKYNGLDAGLKADLLEKLTEGSRIAHYLVWG